MAKIDKRLFSAQADAAKNAYGDCPKCGEQLHLKFANKTSFLACTAYPICDYTHTISSNQVTVIKPMPDAVCPLCQGMLAVKKGRFGMFIGCTHFPECDYIASTEQASSQVFDMACPECEAGKIVKRQSKFGAPFYACNTYPRCNYRAKQLPTVE